MSNISGMVEVYALRKMRASWRYELVFSRLDEQSSAFRVGAAAQ
jgi:hypothetical protein